jgi:hypothetical protein
VNPSGGNQVLSRKKARGRNARRELSERAILS